MAEGQTHSGSIGDERSGMGEAAILVVDDSRDSLSLIGEALRSEGFKSEKTRSAGEALRRLREKEFDLIIADTKMRDMTGLEFLKVAKVLHPDTEVVLTSADGSVNLAVKAISLGAFDLLTKPLGMESLTLSVKKALRKRALRACGKSVSQRVEDERPFEDMVGRCARMQEIFDLIRKVAPTTAPVIIQGESGTGKELVARAIHDNSPRRNLKFLAINSASLPETLLESELFGYRKGAFTGAHNDKMGLLESAHRGTIFLDEIGSMSRHLQGKLLRAMQDGEVVPVGSSERIKVDVRFLAASNRNLREMVDSGDFRKDLYYRLNVVEMTLPPLRERREDIPLLAHHFLQKYSREQGIAPKILAKAAMNKLLKHTWPGNVRELENVIQRALIVSSGPVIKANEIDLSKATSPNVSSRPDLLSMKYHEAKMLVQSEFQRAYVRHILLECNGSMSKAARRCGLSRRGIHKLSKRYGLK